MSHQIYSNRQFKIYEAEHGFIVHNANKPFQEGHTHIDSFDTAKYLTKLAFQQIIPKHLSAYLLVSLMRISEDCSYKNKLYCKLKEVNRMSCGGKKSCASPKPKKTTTKKKPAKKGGKCK